MVVDVFVYFYFIGAGVSLGVASVSLLSFLVFRRLQNKNNVKKRKGVTI